MKRALLVAVGVGLVIAMLALLLAYRGLAPEPAPPEAANPAVDPTAPGEERPPFVDINEEIRRRLDGDRARREAQQSAASDRRAATLQGASTSTSPTAAASADDDDSGEPAAASDRTLVFAADREGIRGAVDESTEAIRDCYSSWLRSQPGLSGKLTVQFLLTADPDSPEFAQVSNVELHDSELGHVFMEGCVASLFEDLQFEAPDGGELTVRYPLVFLAE